MVITIIEFTSSPITYIINKDKREQDRLYCPPINKDKRGVGGWLLL